MKNSTLESRSLLDLALGALSDKKGGHIVSLDVRGMTTVTDYMIIADGASSRHVKSLAEGVIEKAKQAGVKPLGVEGERAAEWILVDLDDVVVHIMSPQTRAFYQLERLWSPTGA